MIRTMNLRHSPLLTRLFAKLSWATWRSLQALAEKAVRMLPANVRARQRLCATLVLLGRPEGQETMEELLRMQPNLTSSYITTTYPFSNPKDEEIFSGALLPAGLPNNRTRFGRKLTTTFTTARWGFGHPSPDKPRALADLVPACSCRVSRSTSSVRRADIKLTSAAMSCT